MAKRNELYQELKAAGVEFSKPYAQYSKEELEEGVRRLHKLQQEQEAETTEFMQTLPQEEPDHRIENLDEAYQALLNESEPPTDIEGYGLSEPTPEMKALIERLEAEGDQRARLMSTPRDPNEMAGQRLNTKEEWEPIRIDDQGRTWYQEEVRKPAFAKPRGRRVMKYNDPGTKTVEEKQGEYTETFEVAGDQQVASEVKITLPSFQVGIYKDPRYPFKVFTYAGAEGFSLFEVEEFWGGADLVPSKTKRIYVSNELCYDIRTTIREIQKEDRRLQLAGKVNA